MGNAATMSEKQQELSKKIQRKRVAPKLVSAAMPAESNAFQRAADEDLILRGNCPKSKAYLTALKGVRNAQDIPAHIDPAKDGFIDPLDMPQPDEVPDESDDDDVIHMGSKDDPPVEGASPAAKSTAEDTEEAPAAGEEKEDACEICHGGEDQAVGLLLMQCNTNAYGVRCCKKWWHPECVSLDEPPDGDWICHGCAITQLAHLGVTQVSLCGIEMEMEDEQDTTVKNGENETPEPDVTNKSNTPKSTVDVEIPNKSEAHKKQAPKVNCETTKKSSTKKSSTKKASTKKATAKKGSGEGSKSDAPPKQKAAAAPTKNAGETNKGNTPEASTKKANVGTPNKDKDVETHPPNAGETNKGNIPKAATKKANVGTPNKDKDVESHPPIDEEPQPPVDEEPHPPTDVESEGDDFSDRKCGDDSDEEDYHESKGKQRKRRGNCNRTSKGRRKSRKSRKSHDDSSDSDEERRKRRRKKSRSKCYSDDSSDSDSDEEQRKSKSRRNAYRDDSSKSRRRSNRDDSSDSDSDEEQRKSKSRRNAYRDDSSKSRRRSNRDDSSDSDSYEERKSKSHHKSYYKKQDDDGLFDDLDSDEIQGDSDDERRAWHSRGAGKCAKSARQQLDAPVRRTMNGTRASMERLQKQSLPFSRSDACDPDDEGMAELAGTEEHYPWVVFGTFCVTTMPANGDGTTTARHLPAPQLHMFVGSKPAAVWMREQFIAAKNSDAGELPFKPKLHPKWKTFNEAFRSESGKKKQPPPHSKKSKVTFRRCD